MAYSLNAPKEALPHILSMDDGKDFPRELKLKIQENFDAIERQLHALSLEED